MPVADRLGRIVLLLLLFAAWQLGEGKYLQAKAWLAQQLLRTAWQQTRDGGDRIAPWPWADTWPVARLEVPRLGIDQIVLADTSGRTLAFGPGHLNGSAPLGEAGNSVLSGHRDTHFSFLRELKRDDLLHLTLPDRRRIRYRVYDLGVVDARVGVSIQRQQRELTLTTCYPFDALLPGGSERYLVAARPVELRF
ncbi:MAG: class GN sortase [Gammaproteobacteria bacterium]|nr:class GN sortase [Gammaproteobacteria bacterium]